MRLFYVILLGFFCLPVFASKPKAKLHYDSARVELKKPSPEKEREIFSDKEFVYDKEAKATRNWLEIFLDWLSGLFGKHASSNPKVTYNVVKWSLIGLFIFGLIFILWKSRFRSLLRGEAKKLQSAGFADLPENIEGINLSGLVEKAIDEKNYRLAVRYTFLMALQSLSKKDLIHWQPAKTNHDYLNELHGKTFYKEFSSLSHVFEYVWYGELAAKEDLYERYKTAVNSFIGNLYA